MALISPVPVRAIRGSAAPPADHPGPGPGPGPAPRAGRDLDLHRVLSLVAALGLLWPEFRAWSQIIAVPSAGLADIALTAATIGLAILIIAARDSATLERLDRWLLVLGLVVLAAGAAATLAPISGYSTDEAAFVQAATKLLLHGHDPYGANLASSLYRYSVPPQFWTYTMTGGFGAAYGYPPLPLLITAPFIWLTRDGQAVPMADVCALAAATIIMFRALPRAYRGLSILVCVALPMLGDLATSGLNAILMLPFLLVVAAGWSSTGHTGRLTRADARRGVALGLALAVNPLSWFTAPFVVVGVARLRQPALGRRRALRLAAQFAGWAGGTFAILNVPFVIWNAGAWAGTVAEPVTGHALPYGQGLVGLSAFLHVGGGAVGGYGVVAALLFVALLALFALEFRRLGPACFLLPSLALFAGSRSLGEYWMLLVPVTLVAVAGWPRSDSPTRPTRVRVGAWRVPRAALLAAPFLPALVALVAVLLTPQPLTINVVRGVSDPRTFSVAAVWLRVRNDSRQTLKPWFSSDSAGQASPPWHVVAGPSELPPGATAAYRLRPATGVNGPPNGQTFVMHAFTAAPLTVSTSGRFVEPGPVATDW